jgi:hypothetical protein
MFDDGLMMVQSTFQSGFQFPAHKIISTIFDEEREKPQQPVDFTLSDKRRQRQSLQLEKLALDF